MNPVPLLWQPCFLQFPKLIPDHASFVKEIAATDPPEHLNSLLNVLQARGMASNIAQGFRFWVLPYCPLRHFHSCIPENCGPFTVIFSLSFSPSGTGKLTVPVIC